MRKKSGIKVVTRELMKQAPKPLSPRDKGGS